MLYAYWSKLIPSIHIIDILKSEAKYSSIRQETFPYWRAPKFRIKYFDILHEFRTLKYYPIIIIIIIIIIIN
jgi:hypothetical protein